MHPRNEFQEKEKKYMKGKDHRTDPLLRYIKEHITHFSFSPKKSPYREIGYPFPAVPEKETAKQFWQMRNETHRRATVSKAATEITRSQDLSSTLAVGRRRSGEGVEKEEEEEEKDC